jgi:hypothetical protein
LLLYYFGVVLEDELETKCGTVANDNGGLYHKELLLNKIQSFLNANRYQCVQRNILGAFTV